MDTPNMRIRTTSFGKCMICEIIQVFWPYLPRNPNSEDTPSRDSVMLSVTYGTLALW